VENPTLLNQSGTFEPFVDAACAASFLAMPRKTLLSLARRGKLPAYGVGEGSRKIWKFRLSELDSWMRTEVISASHRGRLPRRNS
jgi:excisionase family DNA binding protein